jgi:UDP-glucose 4-epimerase
MQSLEEMINAMGLSKAMMEKLMIAKSRISGKGKTIVCGTLYGNVMGSRGFSYSPFYQTDQRG